MQLRPELAGRDVLRPGEGPLLGRGIRHPADQAVPFRLLPDRDGRTPVHLAVLAGQGIEERNKLAGLEMAVAGRRRQRPPDEIPNCHALGKAFPARGPAQDKPGGPAALPSGRAFAPGKGNGAERIAQFLPVLPHPVNPFDLRERRRPFRPVLHLRALFRGLAPLTQAVAFGSAGFAQEEISISLQSVNSLRDTAWQLHGRLDPGMAPRKSRENATY